MKTIIWDKLQRVVDFVAKAVEEEEFIKPCGAIGIEKDGNLLGGVVYECYTGASVVCHIGANTANWMNAAYLYFIFAYPFITLHCNRITVPVKASNHVSLAFCHNLGFKTEGRLRAACSDGSDMIILGMLKDECRFLKDKYRAAFTGYLRRSRPSY